MISYGTGKSSVTGIVKVLTRAPLETVMEWQYSDERSVNMCVRLKELVCFSLLSNVVVCSVTFK